MQQSFESSNIVKVKSQRSHPLRADKILERRTKGEFKKVSKGAKSTSSLSSNFKTVVANIAKKVRAFPVDSSESTLYYDITNMIAGERDIVIKFIRDHAESTTDLRNLDSTLQYFSKYWINDALTDFDSIERLNAKFNNIYNEGVAEDQRTDVSEYVAEWLQRYQDFFAEQVNISRNKTSIRSANNPKYTFDELKEKLGPLADSRVSHRIAQWIKKEGHKGNTVKKTTKSKERVVAKFLVPENANGQIYITYNAPTAGGGKEKFSAKEELKKGTYKGIEPFSSLPHVHLNNMNAAIHFIALLRNNFFQLQDILSKDLFVGRDYHINANDTEDVKARKASLFLETLTQEFNLFDQRSRSGQVSGVVHNQAYNPVPSNTVNNNLQGLLRRQ